MTGVEIIAVVVGSVAGIGLGLVTVRRGGTPRRAALTGGSHDERIDLMGQQRRWVIAAMDRLAEAGVIEDLARRRGHFLHDVADSVDRSCERLEAHQQLMVLWTTVAKQADHAGEPGMDTPETVRVNRELASLQEQIDRLDLTQLTTGRSGSGHR